MSAWNPECRKPVLTRDRGQPTAIFLGRIAQQVDHYRDPTWEGLPPGVVLLPAFFVTSPLESQRFQVLLQAAVGINLRQDLQVQHQVDIGGARMRHLDALARGPPNEVAGDQAAGQVDTWLPRPKPSQQSQQGPLTQLSVPGVVAAYMPGLHPILRIGATPTAGAEPAPCLSSATPTDPNTTGRGWPSTRHLLSAETSEANAPW